MNHQHSQEEKQFSRLFEEEGIEGARDRLKILRVFLSTEEHLTSSRLVELLQEKGLDFDPDFVRETLRFMCRYGFAQKRAFKGRQQTYEHRHLGQHHDHMICTKCGSIMEFVDQELERAQAKVARSHGFHMLQHRMELYGICGDCLKSQVRLMPLGRAKAGETVIVRETTGGSQARHRLLTMGFRPGDRLEVITNDRGGQVVVAAESRRFAMGRGLANKVLVETQK